MTLAEIISTVSEKHGLRPRDLQARTRTKPVTDARSEYFFLALNETQCSSVEIGKSLGMDHTTVLYGAARHAVKNDLPIPRGANPNRYCKHKSQEEDAA